MNLTLNVKWIFTIAFVLGAMVNSYSLYGQCSQANLALTGFQLRDQNGNLFTNTDNYTLGQEVTGELWFFLGGSSTNGYNMRFFFDVIVNGVLTQNDQYECMFPGTALVKGQWVKVRNFTWKWGDIILIQDIFAYWDTNGNASTCGTSTKNNINSQCYSNPSGFAAVVPLFPNFTFNTVCTAATPINFTNNTLGGTSPYTYSWDFGGLGTSSLKDPSFTFTQPGNYTVTLTVTDSQTPVPTVTPISKIVNIPAPITINGTTTSTQINGNTGSINVTVTGGTAPYSYLWTYPNGSTNSTKDISSLAKGTYSLQITDALGCVQNAQFIIHDLLTSDFTFTSTLCNSRIQFTSSTAGGTPPLNYTYEWDFNNDGITDSNLANPIFDFLGSGTYPVTLTVKNGESSITINKTVLIDPNFGIQVTIFPTKINDDSGIIYIESVTGGTPPYTYLWTGPNGFISTDEDIFDLVDGLYQLVVTDANGCQQTEQYEMDIASVLNLTWNSFQLTAKEDKTIIQWEIISEVEGVTYEIQRSLGNIEQFELIATLPGQKPNSGPSKYVFEDNSIPRTHERIYYRILKKRQGLNDYSPVKMIERPFLSERDTWLVYPNPSSRGLFNLNLRDLSSSKERTVTIDLFDSHNFFKTESIPFKPGQTINLQAVFGTLPNGMMILRIQDGQQVRIFKLINEK